MKRKFLILFAGALIASSCSLNKNSENLKSELRAPAVPLVTIDPYTSAWSMTDKLYDSSVKHWTGKDFPLLGVIKIDGETFRFLGIEDVVLEPLSPNSEQQPWDGKYTTAQPAADWMNVDFNDAKWQSGAGAFGTIAQHTEPTARSEWQSEHIWVRRQVEIHPYYSERNVYLEYSNDDDAVFYINGVKVLEAGCCNKNKLFKLPGEIVQSLHPGKNLIAAYCNNTAANGLLDFGLYEGKLSPFNLSRTAEQQSVDVQATQTHYTFTCGKTDLKLTFTAPLLMNDLDLLSRPVNYLSYEITSNDGKAHDIELLFEASSQWATNTPYQQTTYDSFEQDGLIFAKTGTKDQDILSKKGDDLRIDWGYFYLVAEKGWISTVGGVHNSPLSKLKIEKQFGKTEKAAGKIMLGYDDIYSVQYFGENLRPYWNRSGKENIISQFKKAHDEYDKIISDCNRFDAGLMQEATETGGKEYAELCALAYRQSIAAHKLLKAPNGDLLWLSKENFSNGSIGTVDITYPSAPLYLLYNTELVKGLLNHIFYYSESGKWAKPFAAHDVGTYPIANGQTYGGDMPVEETGNMLILTAALATMEGNAAYAEKHWDVLTVWTDYLIEKGLDPENQLCTDDFAGHFAHNANLSIKAILGIASYGSLAGKLNKTEVAEKYTRTAKEMAQEWIRMADAGDHYRLTFDRPDSWSQKYNLVWNKLMQLNIFPEEVAQKEIAYYLTRQNEYGLPLDNRKAYTKADWIIWTATMSNDRETFRQFIPPLYKYVNETASRVPMSDWYWSDSAEQVGFQARSVVGGYFIRLLEEKMKDKN